MPTPKTEQLQFAADQLTVEANEDLFHERFGIHTDGTATPYMLAFNNHPITSDTDGSMRAVWAYVLIREATAAGMELKAIAQAGGKLEHAPGEYTLGLLFRSKSGKSYDDLAQAIETASRAMFKASLAKSE